MSKLTNRVFNNGYSRHFFPLATMQAKKLTVKEKIDGTEDMIERETGELLAPVM